jgi:hypothetical protein
VPDEVVVGVAVVSVVVVPVVVVSVVVVLVVLVVLVVVSVVVVVVVLMVVVSVVVIVGSPFGSKIGVTEGVTAVELGVANAANEWFTCFWTSPRALSMRDWTSFAGTNTLRL